MSHPLYVAIVWHMHQPIYVDPEQRDLALLPWVRLHTAKDYLHMAEVLTRYPNVHVTFNVVPSLLVQMEDFAQGRIHDRLWLLGTQKEWSREEKLYLLNICFGHDPDRVIRKYPRYRELFEHHGDALSDPDAFGAQDYRDLIAWFNLAWIDPTRLERDDDLNRLVLKGHGFTISDILLVHRKQQEIARKVIPLYRKLQRKGSLELSTTPFYHPILPLLEDNMSAREATPDIPLPDPPFSFPEDVGAQLRLARKAYRRWFGRMPVGLWPSEGAVSQAILPWVLEGGFTWLASDEGVLGKSISKYFERDAHGFVTEPRLLYHPYRTLIDGMLGPAIIFRDRELSDKIGFQYHSWPGGQAAEDLVLRLKMIRQRIDDPDNPYLVSIILDGENCWESYEHNGDPFLESLYLRLSEDEELEAVTVGEYVRRFPPKCMLARLAAGSWIRADLTTWIGDPEHNLAWSLLERARNDVKGWKGSGRKEAQEALYIAEGSDWFWWYSHRNTSDQDAMYDRIFRGYLKKSYTERGVSYPPDLDVPIAGRWDKPHSRPPRHSISPHLQAHPLLPDDWKNAGVVLPAVSTGAMQTSDGGVEALYFGTDSHNLYLRLELSASLDEKTATIYIADGFEPWNVNLRHSGTRVDARIGWVVESTHGQPPFLYRAMGYDAWQAIGPVHSALGDRVLEVSLPLNRLGLSGNEKIRFLVTMTDTSGGQELLLGEPLSITASPD